MADSGAVEDNMNVQLKDITVTARDGRVSHLDQVYIRGSHVRFFIVPDMLRYGCAPCSVMIAWVLTAVGTDQCLDQGLFGVGEWVWPEEGRRSTVRGASGDRDRSVVVEMMRGDRAYPFHVNFPQTKY